MDITLWKDQHDANLIKYTTNVFHAVKYWTVYLCIINVAKVVIYSTTVRKLSPSSAGFLLVS